MRIELTQKNDAWGIVLPEQQSLNCKICLNEINPVNTFYFCRTTQRTWCYDCRAKDWDSIKCLLRDDHEHFLITFVEVKK